MRRKKMIKLVAKKKRKRKKIKRKRKKKRNKKSLSLMRLNSIENIRKKPEKDNTNMLSHNGK